VVAPKNPEDLKGKTMKPLKSIAAAILASGLLSGGALAADVTGAGSTFVYPILSKWSAAYTGGSRINYQSIGSGGGIAQIKAKTVTFGASDKPLSVNDLKASGLTQFPVIVGGITLVVHVPGVQAGQLVLDGPTTADIFLGKIRKWNDPAIRKLNPKLALPNMNILVVHRSDGSGTTYIFANFLSKVSPEWSSKVGADTAVEWPVGIGGKGNEGVAGTVSQLAGSIGYVEYAYAMQNHMAYTRLINRNGKILEPNVETFRAGAAGADWASAAGQDFNMVLVNQPGDRAWPITGATWAIMYKNPGDKNASADALKFFKWAYEHGDQQAVALQYVPLPDNAVKAIEAHWKGIQGSGM
jgi:phosphate transport system substrate-binding protein